MLGRKTEFYVHDSTAVQLLIILTATCPPNEVTHFLGSNTYVYTATIEENSLTRFGFCGVHSVRSGTGRPLLINVYDVFSNRVTTTSNIILFKTPALVGFCSRRWAEEGNLGSHFSARSRFELEFMSQFTLCRQIVSCQNFLE